MPISRHYNCDDQSITTTIAIPDAEYLRLSIKKPLLTHIDCGGSRIVSEALARGLGFSKHASILAALQAGSVLATVDDRAFRERLAELGGRTRKGALWDVIAALPEADVERDYEDDLDDDEGEPPFLDAMMAKMVDVASAAFNKGTGPAYWSNERFADAINWLHGDEPEDYAEALLRSIDHEVAGAIGQDEILGFLDSALSDIAGQDTEHGLMGALARWVSAYGAAYWRHTGAA